MILRYRKFSFSVLWHVGVKFSSYFLHIAVNILAQYITCIDDVNPFNHKLIFLKGKKNFVAKPNSVYIPVRLHEISKGN